MTIAAFALASAAFAQTEDKDAAWAAKAAAKAEKAQKAADLKAFKEKQKADLAAFIEAQKSGKSASAASAIVIEKPELANGGDSIAYLLGVGQSAGLKQYMTGQLGVSEEHINQFAEGIMARLNDDPNDKEKAAFNAGAQIATQIVGMAQSVSKDYYSADPDMSIDSKILASGILAGLLGQTDIKADSAMTAFETQMKVRQEANKERLYASNRIAGENYLEENKKKEGVITLPSGLQYKVITAGTGEKPKSTDKVSVDYEGRLIDGTVFDSSYKRGKPSEFGVTQVIKGWTEALQLMGVGSKWEVYIPYQLAYGERETGSQIKPYSALIFTVELKDIVTAPKDNVTTTKVVPAASGKKTATKKK